jgi:hypothetical protein
MIRRLAPVLRIVVALLLLIPAVSLAQTNCNVGAGPLRTSAPATLKPDDIVRRFTESESAMIAGRKSYSFRQDVSVQSLRHGLMPNEWDADGEFRLVMDVSHDDGHGNRVEAVVFAPQSTLHRMSVGKEDMEDIRRFATFALTTSELPHYNVLYAGQQHVDELDTYVFDVAPKHIEKGKRYFQGRIWVEATDMNVVKTCGKSVPDTVVVKKKRVVESTVQPKFATYREFIDGRYWFPTYARSDDVIDFGPNNEVHVREIIHFTSYKSLSRDATMASSK